MTTSFDELYSYEYLHGGKAIKRTPIVALCTSDLCTSRYVIKYQGGRKIKTYKPHREVLAKKNETFCPDCGHALVWAQKGSDAL